MNKNEPIDQDKSKEESMRRNNAAKKIQSFMRLKRKFANKVAESVLGNNGYSGWRIEHFKKMLNERGLDIPVVINEYGLTTIGDRWKGYNNTRYPIAVNRMTQDSQYSALYHRDYSTAAIDDLVKSDTPPDTSTTKHFLVNGIHALDKIRPYINLKSLKTKIETLSGHEGLAILSISIPNKNTTPEDKIALENNLEIAASKLSEIIQRTGSRPTSVEILRYYLQKKIPVKSTQSIASLEIKNLNDLFKKIPFVKIEPKDRVNKKINMDSQVIEGSSFISTTIIKLFKGLKDSIDNIQKHGTESEKLLTEDCLNESCQLFEQLSISLQEGQLNRQYELYRLLMEEVYLILMMDENYPISTEEAFNTRHTKRQYPENLPKFSCLTGSGMDSITAAFSAFYLEKDSKDNVSKRKTDLVFIGKRYFETSTHIPTTPGKISNFEATPTIQEMELDEHNLILKQPTAEPDNRDKNNTSTIPTFYFVTLQSSTPTTKDEIQENRSNPNWVVKLLEENKLPNDKTTLDEQISSLIGDQYITVLIDNTIENNSDALRKFLEKNKDYINSGKLNIILCKSLQKYDSLGFAKSTAGEITVFNSGAPKFANFNNNIQRLSQGKTREKEISSRLATHMMRYASDQVIEFEKIAASNAKFLAENIIININLLNRFAHDENSPLISAYAGMTDLPKCGVLYRDSFGFLESSFCHISADKRISVGIESPKRLFEQFYCLNFLSEDEYQFKEDKILMPLDYTEVPNLLTIYINNLGLDQNTSDALNNMVSNENYDLFLDKLISAVLIAPPPTVAIQQYALNALTSILTAKNDAFDNSNGLYNSFFDKVINNPQMDIITPDGKVYFANTFLKRFEKMGSTPSEGFEDSDIQRILKCFQLLPQAERIDRFFDLPIELIKNQNFNKEIGKILNLSQKYEYALSKIESYSNSKSEHVSYLRSLRSEDLRERFQRGDASVSPQQNDSSGPGPTK